MKSENLTRRHVDVSSDLGQLLWDFLARRHVEKKCNIYAVQTTTLSRLGASGNGW
jgi:hypothetical protein